MIFGMLLASVAAAVGAALNGYSANVDRADLMQATRTVLSRMALQIRTAYEVDSSASQLTIWTDAAQQNGHLYQVVGGTLRYVTITNGAHVKEDVLLGGNEDGLVVTDFSVVRAEEASTTVSVAVTLGLSAGKETFDVTTTSVLRKNLVQ